MKLISKIASLSVGLALAVGVGVAVGSKEAKVVKAADAVMAAGTNSSAATVNGNDAIKCGTSSKKGAMTITLADSGATSLSVYAAGWNNDTGRTVNVSVSGGATISPTSFTLENESGIAGSGSAFTVSDESIHLKEFTLSDAGENTVVTFEANVASKNRYVVWGATYETGGSTKKDLKIQDNAHNDGPFEVTYGDTSEYSYLVGLDVDAEEFLKEGCDWDVEDESVIDYVVDGWTWLAYKPKAVGSTKVTLTVDGYKTATTTITVVPGTLNSIALSGDMSTKTYTLGSSWDPSGLVVTGTYSSGYVGPVVETIAWSYDPENATYGTTSVAVTATVSGKSASKTVTGITVNTVETTPLSDFYNGTEELPTSSSSSKWFYVKGVVVAVNGYQYYIQEGEYGLLVYGNGTNHPIWYEGIAVGDYVLLHAKIYKYVASGDTAGGLVETYNGESSQTVQKLGTAALPDAVEFTTVSSFMSAHQSTRASLSNVAVDEANITTISKFSGTATSDQKFNAYDINSSADLVTVFIHSSVSAANKTAIVEKLQTITTADTVEFVRCAVAYYKGNQISLATADQIIIHTPEEDKVASWGVNYLFIGNPDFDGDGTGACKSANYYKDAKTALLALEDEEAGSIEALQNDDTYEAELARYLAWAKACKDNSPFENDFTFMNAALNMFGFEANPTILIVVAIATASTLAFTMLLVFKKKKHN